MRRFPTGLTLSELLVAMGLLTLIGGIIIAVYISSTRFTADEQDRLEVDISASRVLQKLDETLRQGKAVLASATVDGTLYTTGTATLVFTLPSLLADGSLSPTAVDTAALRQQGSELLLTLARDASSTRSAGTSTLVTNVRDLYLRYTNPTPSNATAVTVAVRTERSLRGTPYTRASLLYAIFRNHP